MNKIRYNKSKTYLLPLLSELVEFDYRFFNCLENTYIADDYYKYKDCIYILHDFSFKNPEFTAYEHKLTNNEYFVDLVDINKQVLYIYRFPEEYMHEYNCFLNGKYSEFGTDAKQLILDFYTGVYEGNPNAVNFLIKVKQILFKDEKLRKQLERDLKVSIDPNAELSDPIELDMETFKLKEIKEEKENKKI